jgi:hypothetical protein
MSRKFFLIIVGLACHHLAHAQVSIGKPTADSSALLDLVSGQQGLLLPRLSQTQRTSINVPGNGLLYYQQSSPEGFYHYKKNTVPAAWLPLLPYELQQNLHLATRRMVSNRVYSGGIAIDSGRLLIQTELPGPPIRIRSPLMIYNPGVPDDFGEASLLSFKTMFGLNLFSFRAIDIPYTYLGIYQNSTGGPIRRLLITSGTVYIGEPSPNTPQPIALGVEGNLKFTGNIDIGFQYDYVDYTLPAHHYGMYHCRCGLNKSIVSGGGGGRDGGSAQQNVMIKFSGPEGNNTWRLIAYNNTNSAKVIRVYAICSNIQHP